MRIVLLVICCAAVSLAQGASVEKAKALRTNGLLPEAKRELVEVTFSGESSQAEKAEALLLLGDIGIDEDNFDVAAENWSKAVAEFPNEPASTAAKEKLVLLGKLTRSESTAPLATLPSSQVYPEGTVLVVGPETFPWSVPQIAGALGNSAAPFGGSITEAMAAAKSDPAIAAVAEISLSVDTAFESGRVVCLLPNGKKVWEEKVMFNLGGGTERIARRFVDGLASKVAKRSCPGKPQ